LITERGRKIAVILAGILQGNLTVSQLSRRITDRKAALPKLTLAQREKIREAISIAEETYDRQKNN
jgi:hypothetical protein